MVPQTQWPVRGVKSEDAIVAMDEKYQGFELMLGETRFNIHEGKHLWDERLQDQAAYVGMVNGCSLR